MAKVIALVRPHDKRTFWYFISQLPPNLLKVITRDDKHHMASGIFAPLVCNDMITLFMKKEIKIFVNETKKKRN